MIDESKSLPVEANNSTIELHLAVEAKEKLSEYIEPKSLPVEVKENFAIVNSKYGSLVEANHSFPNSCFETNSESELFFDLWIQRKLLKRNIKFSFAQQCCTFLKMFRTYRKAVRRLWRTTWLWYLQHKLWKAPTRVNQCVNQLFVRKKPIFTMIVQITVKVRIS